MDDRRVYESPSDETLEREAFEREWKAYQDACPHEVTVVEGRGHRWMEAGEPVDDLREVEICTNCYKEWE